MPKLTGQALLDYQVTQDDRRELMRISKRDGCRRMSKKNRDDWLDALPINLFLALMEMHFETLEHEKGKKNAP